MTVNHFVTIFLSQFDVIRSMHVIAVKCWLFIAFATASFNSRIWTCFNVNVGGGGWSENQSTVKILIF
jgi:hypothetical protein